MLYGLPNTDLHTLQMILNAAVRIIFDMPRYSKQGVNPKAIALHFLHAKARIEQIYFFHKSLFTGEQKFLTSVLRPVLTSGLCSSSSNGLVSPFLSRKITINHTFKQMV